MSSAVGPSQFRIQASTLARRLGSLKPSKDRAAIRFRTPFGDVPISSPQLLRRLRFSVLVKLETYDETGLACIRYVAKRKFVYDVTVETQAQAIATRFYPLTPSHTADFI